MTKTKRCYHPYIPLLYKLNILENDFTCQVPSSTLHEWKNRDFDSSFGADLVLKHFPSMDLIQDYISKRKFARIINASYRIYNVYSNIYSTIKINRSQIEKYQKQIVCSIEIIKETIGFDKALRAFHLSHQQFYRWKNKVNCKVNESFLCRKRHPLQLSSKEIKTIKSYLFNSSFIYWPLSSIYYKMLRNKDAFMSLTTFYKYAKILGFKKQKPHCRNKKYSLGIRANKPFEILHADVTIFKPLDHTKVYIYFIVDNYSRDILGWKASLKLSAKISFDNLHEVYKKYNLTNKPDTILMTDDGSENKAEVDEYISSINMQRLIAQKDIIFSNSIVESVFYKFKYQFLFTKNLTNFHDTLRYLEKAVPEYSYRPHASLFGLTPNEVCNGAIPNKKLFNVQKQLAKKTRIIENKQCKECD